MHESDRPLDSQSTALQRYIRRRLKQGFQIVSQSNLSAELYKPTRFPAFLRKEQSIYVNLDERGRLWVRKSHY